LIQTNQNSCNISDVLIIGLGNIGIINGWAFSEAGINVTHKVRQGKAHLYRNEINLDLLDKRKPDVEKKLAVYKPKIIDTCSKENYFDLIMIPVKHYQLLDAVEELTGVYPHAKYLLFSAIWGSLDEIDKLIPRSEYIMGYAAVNGGCQNKIYYFTVRKDYRVGILQGNDESLYNGIKNIFSKAMFIPDEKENILEWNRVHFGLNGALIGTSIYAGSIQNMIESDDMLKLMINASKDSIKILAALGINVKKYPEVNLYLEKSFEDIGNYFRKDFFGTEAGQRTLKTGHHLTAMEEMKRYYFDVRNTGRKLGFDIPYLEKLGEKIS